MPPESINATEQESETQNEDEESSVKQKFGVEEIINKVIGNSLSVKYLVIACLIIMPNITGPMLVEIPIFAGFIPYEKWECLSKRCFDLQTNQTDKAFYTHETLCRNSLQPGVDITWTTNRTSYAIDWNLFCSNEDKTSNLQSFFFLGIFISVVPVAFLLDTVGRKAVILSGIVAAFAATLGNAFVNSYSAMLPLRIIQGVASFLVQTGIQAMIMEFTPTQLRNVASIMCIFCWSIGFYISIAFSYLIYSWRYNFLVTSIAIIVTLLPALFCPESIRFRLIKGKQAEAKRTLGRLAKFFNNPIKFENIELNYTEYKQHYLKQLKDFATYPAMTRNTVCLLVYYFSVSAHTYSLTYSWGKLGADLFTSQLISVTGNILVVVTGYQYFVTERLGRRRALILNTSIVTLTTLLGIPKVNVSESWTLAEIMCLISAPFNASCWMGVLLLASELAPTSHRGMIVSLNLTCARVGSFVGPYLALLFNVLDIRVVMAIFSIPPLLGVVMVVCSQDSTGRPIPATPAEVQGGERSEEKTPIIDEEDIEA